MSDEEIHIDPRLAAPSGQTHAAIRFADYGPGSEPMHMDEAGARDDNDGELESEISDVDSDYLELNAETAKLDASIEAFRAEQRMGSSGGDDYSFAGVDPSGLRTTAGVGAGAGAGAAAVTAAAKGTRPSRRGVKRGPRKPAKPSPDILYRLSLATEAYHARRYGEAHEMLAEIIRINAETFDAWTLLSTVFEEQGDRRAALMCLVAAAHLTPKEGRMWMNAATYALDGVDRLDDDSPEKRELLQTAMQCYSAAVRANPADVAARTGKADVLMTLGHASLAVSQYCRALKHRPLNIRTVRNLADVALDTRDPRQNSAVARDAYRRIIDYCKAHGTTAVEEGDFEWSDLRIYLEFFHMLEQWADAARELREVARWLLGREAQGFWDRWPDDDREWDINDDRRVEIPEYQPAQFPLESYGMGLPVDLRARLCMYRLKLGHESEAALHLQVLDPADRYHPQDVPALERFRYFPDCLKDVGAALLERSRPAEAIEFFELYRRIAAGNEDVLVDADLLVHQGRCYLALEDKVAAEECFIAAIEEDDGNIDARFELAKIYEGEQEKEGREEAFLLVNEALHLEAQQGGGEDPQQEASRRAAHRRLPPHLSADLRRKRERLLLGQPKRRRRTYRPRRLGGSEERRKYEQERTAALADKYRLCLELKPRLESGDEEDPEAARAWMGAARELIDDFRASKDFYPWDMYVRSQGFVTLFAGQDVPPHANAKLLAMAARLQQNLAPGDGQEHAPPPVIVRHEHRGIPFDEWLDLFLDYALRLAREGQVREAYEICMSAKDSVVFKSKENSFLIHLAHATCAVIAGDEEQCVSVARYFMREYMHCTDSYRIVAALCRVCQTPVSWYSSGPAQKFILRQIRHMDKATLSREAGGENAGVSGLDVCLLTIYGHIMFTTTSYTYALSYFMRAASIDPENPMINLSLGIGYIHYALKRQATNRQYLLTQGFAFLAKYYEDRVQSESSAERQEAHFNMGRAYHIVGLSPLAVEYYRRALDEATAAGQRVGESGDGMGREDLVLEAAYNIKTICFLMGDIEGAKAVTDAWLVL